MVTDQGCIELFAALLNWNRQMLGESQTSQETHMLAHRASRPGIGGIAKSCIEEDTYAISSSSITSSCHTHIQCQCLQTRMVERHVWMLGRRKWVQTMLTELRRCRTVSKCAGST